MSKNTDAKSDTKPNSSQSSNRRSFLKTVGGAAVAGVVGSTLFDPRLVHAAPTAKVSVDSMVGAFYASLSDMQKKAVCFEFDNPLRKRISANWHITKQVIGSEFYSDKQRDIIDQILKGITTDEGYDRLIEQMDYDDGGVESYSVAMFGKPGEGRSQWELTGRHLTLRADGEREDKAAFGGPLVYGHAEEAVDKNLYHYQTKATNEVFKSLDAKQAKQALLPKAPPQSKVQIQGAKGDFQGISVGDLSDEQKTLVESTLKTLLAPYRPEDVEEVMAILKATGGVEKLKMAFYEDGDLKSDKVWDMWRVEGPSFVWHFRGAPHVHAYINIGEVTG